MKQQHKLDWPGLEAEISLSNRFSTISFPTPVRSLSSAILNGGYTEIKRILNLKVQANPEGNSRNIPESWDPPEKTLLNFLEENKWPGPAAGMMTSALMDSFRLTHKEEEWGGVFCALTAGLSNARAAGDIADFHPEVKRKMLPSGTINITVGTNIALSDAALAEAIMIATEAKTAVLSEYDIKSTLSGSPATGTGTDSIIIISGNGQKADFCGKHTKIGQLIGETVTEALSSSVEYLITRDSLS